MKNGLEPDDAPPGPVFCQRPPKRLYRYRSLAGEGAKFTEDIVVNSHFYWPAPADFNDPFDFSPIVEVPKGLRLRSALLKLRSRHRELSGTSAGFNHAPKLGHAEVRRRLARALEETTQKAGVLCFSEVRDSVLMWGHYADCHRGICLEFDPNIPEIEPSNMLYRVEYQESRPRLQRFLDREHSEEFARALTTKAAFWSYEKEWRAIDGRGAGKRTPFSKHALTGIIFGSKATEETVAMVREWVQLRGSRVHLSRARLQADSFALDIEPID